MTNKIEILSPGPGCRKTKKIVRSIKSFLENHHLEYEMQIITNQDSFTKYRTWILPTVIINNKITSRGYRPSTKVIIDALNQ